jgi:hypothetical protein
MAKPKINQEYHEEATVLVWRNINRLKFIPTSHFGHAAVMLRGPASGANRGEYKYISWWPGEGAGKKDAVRDQAGFASNNFQADMISELSPNARTGLQEGRFAPRTGQVETDYANDNGDVLWGQMPDVCISVPGINRTDSEFGLSQRRMYEWYEAYQKNNGTYRLASTKSSCAGVAAAALVEGGAEAFAKAPTGVIYLEPKQVETFAQDIRQKIVSLNQRAALFELDCRKVVSDHIRDMKGVGVTGRAPSRDLWDHATWLRQSEVKGSVRSSDLRIIDTALKEYHNHDWKDGFKEKYKSYINVLTGLMDHAQKKPVSERSLPRAQLGVQVFDVLRSGALA